MVDASWSWFSGDDPSTPTDLIDEIGRQLFAVVVFVLVVIVVHGGWHRC